jgi:oxygen-independent coproporphyrinogen-3 oxidase
MNKMQNPPSTAEGMPFPTGAIPEPGRYLANVGPDPLSGAFREKFVVHAGRSGAMLAGREAAEAYLARLAAPGGPCAFYVHMPFCRGRCLFCGFAGKAPTGGIGGEYCSAVVKEIEFIARAGGQRGPVRTVYFGGGTPSCMAPEDLARVLSAMRGCVPFANDCEITLEGAVHDFSPENVSAFLEAGFNRFSIGIQTFDTAVRRSMGRVSGGDEALSRLREIASRQMAALIIDLIYGLPGQTLETFSRDLDLAATAGLDGLDTYQLNVFPGGELARAAEGGRVPRPAPLAEQGRYYALAWERLRRLRFRPLSLSHYARGTRERNFYNPWAKRRQDCLAAGAGAGGFLEGWSSYRKPDPEAYIRSAAAGEFSPDFLVGPPPSDALSSFVVGDMEEGVLDIRALEERFGAVPPAFSRLLDNWQEAGLVSVEDGLVTLTVAGRFWGVNLAQASVDTLSGA